MPGASCRSFLARLCEGFDVSEVLLCKIQTFVEEAVKVAVLTAAEEASLRQVQTLSRRVTHGSLSLLRDRTL